MRKEAELVAKNMRLSEENDELHKKLRLVEHTNESKFLSWEGQAKPKKEGE